MATKRKHKDTKRVSVVLPEDLYIAIKQLAKEDYRTVSQEIRFLLEIGAAYVSQSDQCSGEDGEGELQEGAPAIGFRIPPQDGEDEDYDED